MNTVSYMELNLRFTNTQVVFNVVIVRGQIDRQNVSDKTRGSALSRAT